MDIGLLSIISLLITLPLGIHSVTPNTGPAYLGCHFIDKEIKAMPNNKWVDSVDMNIEMCIDHCGTNEQTLAGLYNGNVCVCSEKLPTMGEAHSTYCKTMCPGNNGEKCGGPTSVSIYSICDAIHYHKNCEFLCYCDKKMSCNFMTGICLNKKCDFEHTGDRCDAVKDALFMVLVKKFVKALQKLWEMVKGFFIVEEKIPEVCESGRYGIMCEIPCHCAAAIDCDRVTGVCGVKKCATGWIGRRCDKPNPCDNSPCVNNGRCELDGMKVICHCVPPHVGRNCETVDPCIKKPCANNGNCITLGSNYRCDCTGYYFGERCESDIRNSPDTHVYISCFRELETDREFAHQVNGNDKQMQPSVCSKRCRTNSFTYAGLQVGNQCWCSNSLGKYGGIPNSQCSQACSGDKQKKCGERNANSVYAVCPIGRYKIDCKGICNCLRDQCDLTTGNCPQERCKTGFTGARCDIEFKEPTGDHAKRKQYVVLILAAYAAFVIIETVVFVLQHFRIIRRLPIASLTPEGPQPPTEVIPPEDETKTKPLETDEVADQNPVTTTAPTTLGTEDKSPLTNESTAVGSSVMPVANVPPRQPPPPSLETTPLPGASTPMPFAKKPLIPMPKHASFGNKPAMPTQPPFANTPIMPIYNPAAVQYPYNAQQMVTPYSVVPQANVHIPATAPPAAAATEKHEESDED